MFMKKFKNRQFDYTPRYYNPLTDPEERRKRKLSFRTNRHAKPKTRSWFLWLLMLVIVVYLYLRFTSEI